MKKETTRLAKVKDYVGICQAVATTIAIIAAGIWFFCQGIHSPKANVSHLVTHRQLDDDWNWVHVAVTIKNIGQRPLTLKKEYCKVRVQKIYPLETRIKDKILRRENPVSEKSCVVDWPEPCKPLAPTSDCTIWPGEEERLEFEFIIPISIQSVKIYSYFEKQHTPQLGWSDTTIYDLTKKKELKL